MKVNQVYNADCIEGLQMLPSDSVDSCVTSPPYWGLRDYGVEGQLGLEKTPEEYVQKLQAVFAEVLRVLKPTGTLWLNLGDSYIGGGRAGKGKHAYGGLEKGLSEGGLKYGLPTGKIAGYKNKDLVGIPWMVAFALRSSGWYLRQDIIWHKPNPMPESVTDRCTKSHEHIFLLSKRKKYYYNHKSISEKSKYADKDKRAINGPTQSERSVSSPYQCKRQGVFCKDGLRNKRDVWIVPTRAYRGAHFATFPQDLIRDCIKAGCPENGIVLDPFFGAGTTGVVAQKLNRNFIGIELNPDYVKIAEERLRQELRDEDVFK